MIRMPYHGRVVYSTLGCYDRIRSWEAYNGETFTPRTHYLISPVLPEHGQSAIARASRLKSLPLHLNLFRK